MRLHRIRTELTAIRRQLRMGRRQVSQEQLQRYAVDGTLPDDGLTLAYVNLSRAALDAMNASVGGDSEAAAQAYEQALVAWQQALKGGAL